ncbi:hypothetical protein CEXT_470331 [Caerostris extrusa]|uniref:Uncharacterized protein n=1 Tax=Caerostris extrusa TaxID=172846 RepID=A0AAV4QM17_CAEEX|nr:hypothetical protein CEXT_470331 [Caerostris extrusa]
MIYILCFHQKTKPLKRHHSLQSSVEINHYHPFTHVKNTTMGSTYFLKASRQKESRIPFHLGVYFNKPTNSNVFALFFNASSQNKLLEIYRQEKKKGMQHRENPGDLETLEEG